MGKETSPGTVRALVEGDLDWLMPMDAGSFAEAWEEVAWRNELGSRLGHYIALEQDGVPVAFGGFWLVAGEAQVMRLAVDPGRRGEKLGLRLLEAMQEEARRLDAFEMTLEVRESNIPARRTYDHVGFAECGRREGYYGDNGEAAILMRCDL
ncbi:ribosomal protein S18-alanine N-acetyltransferase [Acidaminococcus timonensis]|uniref:ribosomal protein S18-alanine N-acetyltransferase n=1 Tax=Acidaminococcus timonensis TaxID=1871002 RepID=UPI002598B23C|nr:ribosomal protein S18-alanine N-acetyltransferase [uncultured Acidaminococcus sp.]